MNWGKFECCDHNRPMPSLVSIGVTPHTSLVTTLQCVTSSGSSIKSVVSANSRAFFKEVRAEWAQDLRSHAAGLSLITFLERAGFASLKDQWFPAISPWASLHDLPSHDLSQLEGPSETRVPGLSLPQQRQKNKAAMLVEQAALCFGLL